MRGPIVDLVLLMLVVAFFGVQQRRRTEAYFRFWVVGWALVVASMVVWEFDLSSRSLHVQMMQEAIREALLACGGLTFVFSFVAKQRQAKVSLLQMLLIALPLCIALDLIVTEAHDKGLLIVLVILGEIAAGATSWIALRHHTGWLLWLKLALCPVFAGWMVYVIVTGNTDALMQIALGHIFLVSGLLFSSMKRRGGRSIGSVGFFLWAACYLLAQPSFMPERGIAFIYSVWSIPKYLVVVGMILKLFTKVQAEFAELNARHQTLYEDYRLLFDRNPHPMWIYDIQTCRFLAVNEAAVSTYGYPRERFLEMKVDDLRGDRDEPAGPDAGLETMSAKHAMRHRKADGRSFDVDLTARDISFEGRQARFVLAVDITERESLHRELVRQAHYDALTGLPNRVMLEDRIGQWLTRCIREESMGAFLTIDIDHFKRVNDTYGHQMGDACLKLTAERLRSRVRQVDTIARTGGEEFTIVVGGLKTRVGAEKICAELLNLFVAPVKLGGHEMKLTISIGVALYPGDGVDIETLRRRSDQALYRAKRGGRNRAVFASDPVVEET